MWTRLTELFHFGRLSASVAACSDRGLVRADNQDHILVRRDVGLFCVADGMGGGDGGAQASEIVCASIDKAIRPAMAFPARPAAIDAALQRANEEIRRYARAACFRRQMATTAAVLAVEGRRGVIGHVGDSRVYRYRAGRLRLLTEDHTLAHEINPHTQSRASANAHILTRAIGAMPRLVTDWRKVDVCSGDVFLICSDGVHDMLSDGDIASVLAADGTVDVMVARLSSEILAAGAADNYSMIIVAFGAGASGT